MAFPVFDPATMAVDSRCDEPAVPAERINPQWLRYRFSNPPAWIPEVMPERPLTVGRNRWIPAAVLVPIVVHDEDDLRVLLTRRAAHLQDHAGQISFPGGRVDLTDSSRIETALREMEEEVGVGRHCVDILGTLPEYLTGTGYRVMPVVSLVHPPFSIQTDPYEVAEVFEVPLSWLLTGANYERRSADIPGRAERITFYAVPYQSYMIWGATAGMLRNLFHFLRT
ncbi:MAG: CoA pyrophosphatase [Burkholderiaceae bacterium]|jgi:8-oxo-dGTP pyrophosphatase MutT (NUDIX family)|nr:CoA pyrophosphatase [Burkholderiaceae bacterium]